MKKHVAAILLLCSLLVLSSCGDTGYLLQCVAGHWDILQRAEPIDAMLARGDLPPELQEQLKQVVSIRQFAVDQLNLPDSGSYRHYADLGRPYAVWNVVAAPEFSLDLMEWCFPFAGCVSYRGYFEEEKARLMAASLAVQGYDTEAYGVHAYSTLNWFSDPVLNTFLAGGDIRLAALLFHEMAHQVVYVPGDTVFNESFAKAVELEGVRLWLQDKGDPAQWLRFAEHEKRYTELQTMLAGVSDELKQLYAQPLQEQEMRALKKDALERLNRKYAALRESWGGYAGFDVWMSRGWNNARLGSMITYQDLVPVFQSMLSGTSHDFNTFYVFVKSLASMPQSERLALFDHYKKMHLASLQPQ